MDERLKKLGLKIAYYRKLKGYTQFQLAERLGISRTHMSNIEAPNTCTSISLGLLFDIADELGIDVKDLFDLKNLRRKNMINDKERKFTIIVKMNIGKVIFI